MGLRVLVTGSAGFLAGDLIPKLRACGAFVVGVDKRTEPEQRSDLFYQADLTKPFTAQVDFNLCIHLASNVGGFLHNAHNPRLVEDELAIVDSVIKCCKGAGCTRIVYTSSIAVFEGSTQLINGPLTHTSPVTPYAKAKIAGESFLLQNAAELVVVRPTNIFGRGQLRRHSEVGYSHVIPDLLHKIDSAVPFEILGDGQQIRNFIHVSDVSTFLLRVVEKPQRGWFNIRSNVQLSISALAGELLQFRNSEQQPIYRPEFMRYEPNPIGLFDIGPAMELGWSPQVSSIKEGLGF